MLFRSDAPSYDKRRDDWHSYDPFADQQALRNECQQELVRHLRHDHGPVSSVRLADAHLEGRQLAGHGDVSWANGEFSKITYTCQYDRTGRVVAGGRIDGGRSVANGARASAPATPGRFEVAAPPVN